MPNPKTQNLGLDLIDRTSPGTTYLNLQTNLDDNWDKIDKILPLNAMSRQAFINENFDIWQRGTSFTNPPGTGTFTADRVWITSSLDGGVWPANIVHSRLTLAPGELPGSYYAYRISTDGPGNGFAANAFYSITHNKIENGSRYLCGLGKKIPVSFWARSDIPGKRIGLAAFQNYGSGGNPSAQELLVGKVFTLTTEWTKYTVMFDTKTLAGKTFGTNNDDYVRMIFQTMWGVNGAANFSDAGGTAEGFGTGNVDIAQLQGNAGEVALPFQPRSFAEELQLCQRYYETSYETGLFPAAADFVGSPHFNWTISPGTYLYTHQFRAKKRIPPTVKLYSPQTGAADNVAVFSGSGYSDVATAAASSQSNFRVSFSTALASPSGCRFHFAADAEL